jgi:hypothetical protein
VLRERFRKKLNRYLELAPDESFLGLVWAANMIQAGQPEAGLKHLKNVHQDAITEDLTSRRHIHKWELETIVNELLTIPKRQKPLRGVLRELDCTRYDAFIDIVNTLRGLENAEAGLRLKRVNILREMPRISARQFDWQRGWLNYPQFYRSAFIYGQGASAAYFESTHGLTVNTFSLIGFALHANLNAVPVTRRNLDLRPLPLSTEEFENGLRLLCLPISEARQTASTIRRRLWPIEYQPSVLRQFPCISFGDANERIRSPLPQLILERITAGIFYDVAGAGWAVREEYSRRFEEYALRYLKAVLPDIEWQPEQVYRIRKVEFRGPDILWQSDSGLRLAIECKATRMSIDARYSDDPLAVRGYDDLIKAVFQLWRYFSHCRRGLTGVPLRANVAGLVLTLDSWLLMANDLIDDILDAATKMAAKRDPEILAEDRKPILFSSMTDVETTFAKASKGSFDAAISKAVDENRAGWMLSSSHNEVAREAIETRPYPFLEDMARLLPWWKWIEDRRAGQGTGIGQ